MIHATKKYVLLIPSVWPTTRENSCSEIGHSLDLDKKTTWCGTDTYKLNGQWDDFAKIMMIIFVKVDIPCFVQQAPWNEDP